MFIHQSRLEHLLPPSAYHSPEHHRRELDHVFKPSWHLVACKADLPKNGDYITFDLFGQPLLLRNFDGDVRCFLNVCAHRHALLTSKPRGSSPQLVCQYHGWEYRKDGRTARIPDARCFKPWDRENAHLKTVRTELCGDLIFVCLDPEAPELAEHLGPYAERLSSGFSSPYRHVWTLETDHKANWKVIVENSLESYHLPLVHPRTFGQFRPEEDVEHELDERFTWYRQPEESLKFYGWCAEKYGVPACGTYEHHNLHPNITLSESDCVRLIMSVFPTSPTTCRFRQTLFTLRGHAPGWFGEAAGWLVTQSISWFAKKVISEDVGIYPVVQRGLEASDMRGVIGTREERVFVFQKYILDRCAEGRAAAGDAERADAEAAPVDPGPSRPAHGADIAAG